MNFGDHAQDWWSEEGKLKGLHLINPLRVSFIKKTLDENKKLLTRVLDVGCGAGLLCEPLARLGAQVVGIDEDESLIKEAQKHCALMGLSIDYQRKRVEEIKETFPLVCALEIIEHIEEWQIFLKSICDKVEVNGILIISTLNRTLLSYFLGIKAAEGILGLAPKGSHQFHLFRKPSEIASVLREKNFKLLDIKGIRPSLLGSWKTTSNLSINYILAAQRLGS